MPDSADPHVPGPDDVTRRVPAPQPPTPKSGSEPTPPSPPGPMQDLPLAEELQKLLAGGYLVESFLGHGGMGAVYQGLQMPLRRPVAIKILRRGAGGHEDAEQRFQREAYAMAELIHPHIVQVYDCGAASDDYLFI